jgi:hypothetical protein
VFEAFVLAVLAPLPVFEAFVLPVLPLLKLFSYLRDAIKEELVIRVGIGSGIIGAVVIRVTVLIIGIIRGIHRRLPVGRDDASAVVPNPPTRQDEGQPQRQPKLPHKDSP